MLSVMVILLSEMNSYRIRVAIAVLSPSSAPCLVLALRKQVHRHSLLKMHKWLSLSFNSNPTESEEWCIKVKCQGKKIIKEISTCSENVPNAHCFGNSLDEALWIKMILKTQNGVIKSFYKLMCYKYKLKISSPRGIWQWSGTTGESLFQYNHVQQPNGD